MIHRRLFSSRRSAPADAAIDTGIDDLLTIVGYVVRDERAAPSWMMRLVNTNIVFSGFLHGQPFQIAVGRFLGEKVDGTVLKTKLT